MAHKVADRVKETTSTTGTGAYTTTGAVSGFDTLASLLTTDGDTTWVCGVNGAEWEVALITRTSSTTFARTAVLASSNADALVSFSSAPTIFCTLPASQIGTASPSKFRAYRSGNQTGVTASVFTKVAFNAESFDTDGEFDSTTNFRFQPKQAGWYQLNWLVTSSTSGSLSAKLYKNGSAHSEGNWNGADGGTNRSGGNDLVYLNGSSDYVEVFAYTGTTSFEGNSDQTFFSGFLVAAGVSVAFHGPVFSAYPSSVQALSAGYTKVLFQTEVFDPQGSYDATNSKFQPQVPGYYRVSAQVHFTSAAVGEIVFYKNGAAHKVGGSFSGAGQFGSALIYLNGTTDYVEVYVYSASAQNTNAASTGGVYTHFEGEYAGSVAPNPVAVTVGPVFAAKPSAQQAFTANVYAKVTANVVEFDTGGAYDSSISRFQPKAAGYYRITGEILFTNSTLAECSIFKNGTQIKVGTSGTGYAAVVTALVYLNGSTDYVELWGFSTSSQNTHSSISVGCTHFEGEYVGGSATFNREPRNADSFPAAANAADDEFENATLDTVGSRRAGATPWAWRNQGSVTASQADGALVLTMPSNGGSDNVRMLEQALPASGTWKYRAKVSGEWSSTTVNASVGIGLFASGSGKIVSFTRLYWAGVGSNGVEISKYNSASSWNSTYFSNSAGRFGPAPMPLYHEVEWDGTNYHMRVSSSGVSGSYQTLASFTPADFLGTADKIFVGGNPQSQAVFAVVDWFRRVA
jgi:hypothetical protein